MLQRKSFVKKTKKGAVVKVRLSHSLSLSPSAAVGDRAGGGRQR
jgi:hypothetical protein